MHEATTKAVDRLLDQVSAPVDFGPLVSEEFRRGYSAARLDILPLIDVGFTEILVRERRRRAGPKNVAARRSEPGASR